MCWCQTDSGENQNAHLDPGLIHRQGPVGPVMVGVAGFEPATSCSQSKRATTAPYSDLFGTVYFAQTEQLVSTARLAG